MNALSNLHIAWAELLMSSLVASGVRNVIVSPGSRSTPLVLAAAKEMQLNSRVIVDERSAAFFALGQARAAAQHRSRPRRGSALRERRPQPRPQGAQRRARVLPVLPGEAPGGVHGHLSSSLPFIYGEANRIWRRLAGQILHRRGGGPPKAVEGASASTVIGNFSRV